MRPGPNDAGHYPAQPEGDGVFGRWELKTAPRDLTGGGRQFAL